MNNYENYGPYVELAKNHYQKINVSSITKENWEEHFNSILNIMRDGIETEEFQSSFINVTFMDGENIDLSIIDYLYNIIMWILPILSNVSITSMYLFFEEHITKKSLKHYIDDKFIRIHRGIIPNKIMSNIIDECLSKFPKLDEFSFYLMNTINLEDTIDLMNSNKEFNDLIHTRLDDVPLPEVGKKTMDNANREIEIIKQSEGHCFKDFFNAGEGINPKQFKEVFVALGAKPDGRGNIYPYVINNNFITGGVNDLLSYFIESSSSGRVAQIIIENNVGDSGHFARLLGLNNIDTWLNEDPNYDCHTKNFVTVEIKNQSILNMLENSYYRLTPNGVDQLISKYDKSLIGKTILWRSPMTCASFAHGHGICHKCYGELYYTNLDINVGRFASEQFSSVLTQRMLSAKHLLEASYKKLEWSAAFNKYFKFDYNTIQFKDEVSSEGFKIIIDPAKIDTEDGMDEDEIESSTNEYVEFIKEFEIMTPTGQIEKVLTEDGDPLYISVELNELIRHKASVYDDDKIIVDLFDFEDTPLFLMQISNNDLSETLKKLKNIVDNTTTISDINKDNWVQNLLEVLIEGGLSINAIHGALILANQIRDINDSFEKPDWLVKDIDYQCLTLKQALNNNPSIIISLLYSVKGNTLYNPLTFRKNKPSFMDLFFMKNLVETLSPEQLKKKPIEEKVNANGLKQVAIFHDEEKESVK